MNATKVVVDVHTHVYLPRYLSLLRSRTSLPRIAPGAKSIDPERLIILPDEDKSQSTSSGRPIGPEYYDVDVKLSFMKRHAIDISVIRFLIPSAFANYSLANPWLDFLPSSRDTLEMAKSLNDDLQSICLQHPKSFYAFGVLPSAASPVSAWIDTLNHISQLSHIKGVILGTKGLGKGLDDPNLDPIWSRLETYKLMAFIHPHYGIGKAIYGDSENGHVLPLALGFPFETTIV
jgi:aminocarboxymuconate-semialdehyde decarboxylase